MSLACAGAIHSNPAPARLALPLTVDGLSGVFCAVLGLGPMTAITGESGPNLLRRCPLALPVGLATGLTPLVALGPRADHTGSTLGTGMLIGAGEPCREPDGLLLLNARACRTADPEPAYPSHTPKPDPARDRKSVV